ncbi:pyridoxal phosphate-dependent transferase [Microdochium trichocladiopsis]|uniref:Pyridoxal phosphate-dependent transferase n=1 Tax=Microdochium trichocladiopsis TaxID=1682393 RepID=A0A9P9BRG4_9PEZI|nr:pyridoxal phosphate-dependent transferase [Microdochium trichocladiopsis]KAH7035878.1 pyridoxal phosphate-dependent transferase [Microdochium trichocladiopsis]
MGATENDAQATLPIRPAPAAANGSSPATFGPSLLGQFPFDPEYRNMNHGSFGSIPKAIQAKLRDYQDQAEAKPDKFIRFTGPQLRDESRAAVAKVLNAPTDTVVLVSNATTALNVVLRNLTWNPDGKDEILYFQTIYGACGKTVDYIVDTNNGNVSSRCITITYPAEDDEIVELFRAAVKTSTEQDHKRPRVCIIDSVSSLPGVRFPWEAVTGACRELGVLSLVDGAQGIGMIDIDLAAADPDFFLSNCHKWLHTPRGCAVLYVPLRNQHLMVSTLPTSHGYIPKSAAGGPRANPLPKSAAAKSAFVSNFEFSGTIDNSPYYCIQDAVRWREQTLGGEAAVIRYCEDLARAGGLRIAEMLGTKVLDNKSRSLSRCAMTNVCLPVKVVDSASASATAAADDTATVTVPAQDVPLVLQWIQHELPHAYGTFVPVYLFQGEIWTRVSAQVYLDLADFEWLAERLREIVARVSKGDYKA